MIQKKIKKLLIANRGEIACKIIKCAKKLNIPTLAIYSDVDIQSLHCELADEAVNIPGFSVSDTYMNSEAIIKIAKKHEANAIHPGYGLLSENADFVRSVEQNKLIFVGPSSDIVKKMGEKDKAKILMQKAGLPVVPGYHGSNQQINYLIKKAGQIGYPLLIKARSGGGGRGMRIANNKNHFPSAFEEASNEAKTNFKDKSCLLEKYIPMARHIEIQIFADKFGNVIHLFDRDCSLQRRQQKVIEEAPSPHLSDEIRQFLGELSVKAAKFIKYEGAGTIEFIADIQNGLDIDKIYFMEMNTRIQVEHPVTEAITSTNLIAWQLEIANGLQLPVLQENLNINGWAVEARLYAENVDNNFAPQSGTIHHLNFPDEIKYPNCKIETGIRNGDYISPFYDPMIAKIISHGDNRNQAIEYLKNYLSEIEIAGIKTNLDLLIKLLKYEDFKFGKVNTKLIESNIDNFKHVVDNNFIALAAVAIFIELKNVNNQSIFEWYMWNPNVYPLNLIISEKKVLFKITYHQHDEIEVNFHNQTFFFKSIIKSENNIKCNVGNKILNLNFQSIKKLNNHDKAFTFFSKQDTFEIINPNLLQSKDTQNNNYEDSIIAPMHGVIKFKKIKPNLKVKKGDVLFILEAMKMEFSLTAPRDGVIEKIFIVDGEQVSEKSTLLRLKND